MMVYVRLLNTCSSLNSQLVKTLSDLKKIDTFQQKVHRKNWNKHLRYLREIIYSAFFLAYATHQIKKADIAAVMF